MTDRLGRLVDNVLSDPMLKGDTKALYVAVWRRVDENMTCTLQRDELRSALGVKSRQRISERIQELRLRGAFEATRVGVGIRFHLLEDVRESGPQMSGNPDLSTQQMSGNPDLSDVRESGSLESDVRESGPQMSGNPDLSAEMSGSPDLSPPYPPSKTHTPPPDRDETTKPPLLVELQAVWPKLTTEPFDPGWAMSMLSRFGADTLRQAVEDLQLRDKKPDQIKPYLAKMCANQGSSRGRRRSRPATTTDTTPAQGESFEALARRKASQL